MSSPSAQDEEASSLSQYVLCFVQTFDVTICPPHPCLVNDVTMSGHTRPRMVEMRKRHAWQTCTPRPKQLSRWQPLGRQYTQQ